MKRSCRQVCDLTTKDAQQSAAIEKLLRLAVESLGGGGTAADAAEYSLVLAEGTKLWPSGDRRKTAAKVYGLSVGRYRRAYAETLRAARRGQPDGLPRQDSALVAGPQQLNQLLLEWTPIFLNADDKWFLTQLRARHSESAIRGTWRLHPDGRRDA